VTGDGEGGIRVRDAPDDLFARPKPVFAVVACLDEAERRSENDMARIAGIDDQLVSGRKAPVGPCGGGRKPGDAGKHGCKSKAVETSIHSHISRSHEDSVSTSPEYACGRWAPVWVVNPTPGAGT